MFEEIFESYNDTVPLSSTVRQNLLQTSKFYNSISAPTRDILYRIKEKYSYTNRDLFAKEKLLDTHLEFWRSSGGYDIGLCLADITGVYDLDDEFGCFIKEESIEGFVEFGNTNDSNIYWLLRTNLFYTWLSYIWQSIEGYKTLMPVKMVENNSALRFSLNDFAWEDFSNFNNFIDVVKPVEKFFTRELAIPELYSRCDLKYSYSFLPKLNRILNKDSEFKRLKLEGNEFSIVTFNDKEIISIEKISGKYTQEMNDDKLVKSIELATSVDKEHKSMQKIFIDNVNKLMNENWIDTTFKSLK